MSEKRWLNINADSGEKTWLTPKYIIDALGHFDLDPCCPDNMPWRTADIMLTKKEDGTTAPWKGRVWLNPPYGRDAWPFLDRMCHHSGGGVALIFVRTDARQWHDYVFPFADSVFFIRGRIRFCRADGTQGDSCPTPSALVAYSHKDTIAIRNSGLKGTLVLLKQETMPRRVAESDEYV